MVGHYSPMMRLRRASDRFLLLLLLLGSCVEEQGLGREVIHRGSVPHRRSIEEARRRFDVPALFLPIARWPFLHRIHFVTVFIV